MYQKTKRERVFHCCSLIVSRSFRPNASCHPTLHADATLVMTADGGLWLMNPSGTQLDLGPGELCGFNLGTNQPKPKGSWEELKSKSKSRGFRKDEQYTSYRLEFTSRCGNGQQGQADPIHHPVGHLIGCGHSFRDQSPIMCFGAGLRGYPKARNHRVVDG